MYVNYIDHNGFQYRQRYQEGYNAFNARFNGKNRQAFQYRQRYQEGYNRTEALSESQCVRRVSIPTTVSGGLQFVIQGLLTKEKKEVSIPTTVSGGLQYGGAAMNGDIIFEERGKLFQYRQRYQEGYN